MGPMRIPELTTSYKIPSVVLTWVHPNNGTIPLSNREHPLAHLLSHSQFLRENVDFKCKSNLVIMTY